MSAEFSALSAALKDGCLRICLGETGAKINRTCEEMQYPIVCFADSDLPKPGRHLFVDPLAQAAFVAEKENFSILLSYNWIFAPSELFLLVIANIYQNFKISTEVGFSQKFDTQYI